MKKCLINNSEFLIDELCFKKFFNENKNLIDVKFEFKRAPAQSEKYKEEHNPNGCDPIDLLKFTKSLIEYFNSEVPCRENSITITKLDEAIMWQEKRTQDRIKRNIEGSLNK